MGLFLGGSECCHPIFSKQIIKMRLTIKNISAFLMEKGLLKPKSVVDGDFMVTQTQNRNAIFKIHIKNNKSLFVKQLVNFDPQNTYFLQKDATCLWLIKNEKTFANLAQYVPEYYGYDPEKQVLIVEYLPEAKNLEEVYQTQEGMSPALLKQAAKIMSSFHFKLEEQTMTNRAVQFFMRQLPWTFQFALSPESNAMSMYGQSPVVDYLKKNESFLNLMKDNGKLYEVSSLIHGDIKGVNFILQNEQDPSTLKIIDWELSDIGDPLWDVAGFIQSLFVSQIIKHTAATPYQASNNLSEVQMTQNLEEIKILWETYSQLQKFDTASNSKALNKTIKFAGMRLIQTAFEHNMNSQQLQANVIKILQISHSLMQNSENLVAQIIQPKIKTYEPVR